MAAELTVLGLAVVLALVQLVLYAVPANREVGVDWTTGPRDTPALHKLSVRTGRLQRAYANHIEGLVLFGAAVLIVVASGRGSDLTAMAAWVYLAARVIYVPLYWAGVPMWRSVVWMVGLTATMIMIGAALLGA